MKKTNLHVPDSKLLAQRTGLIALRFRLFAQPRECPIPQHYLYSSSLTSSSPSTISFQDDDPQHIFPLA